jgi:hypothetical protein
VPLPVVIGNESEADLAPDKLQPILSRNLICLQIWVIIYLTQVLVAETILLQQSRTANGDKSSILRQVDSYHPFDDEVRADELHPQPNRSN